MDNLIGRRIEIELYVTDAAMSYQRGPNPRPIPQLPVVSGTCIQKVLYPGERWGYLVKLARPLPLDCEGINEKARRLFSTQHVLISPGGLGSGDHICARLNQGKIADSIVSAVTDADKVPNELSKDDPAWAFLPSISSALVRLIP